MPFGCSALGCSSGFRLGLIIGVLGVLWVLLVLGFGFWVLGVGFRGWGLGIRV